MRNGHDCLVRGQIRGNPRNPEPGLHRLSDTPSSPPSYPRVFLNTDTFFFKQSEWLLQDSQAGPSLSHPQMPMPVSVPQKLPPGTTLMFISSRPPPNPGCASVPKVSPCFPAGPKSFKRQGPAIQAGGRRRAGAGSTSAKALVCPPGRSWEQPLRAGSVGSLHCKAWRSAYCTVDS